MEFPVFLTDIAKNKYLKSYERKQEPKNVIYLDANYLYDYAMPPIDPKVFDLKIYTSNSSKSYVIKFDLQYPKELRELHNDFPLFPKEKCRLIFN